MQHFEYLIPLTDTDTYTNVITTDLVRVDTGIQRYVSPGVRVHTAGNH